MCTGTNTGALEKGSGGKGREGEGREWGSGSDVKVSARRRSGWTRRRPASYGLPGAQSALRRATESRHHVVILRSQGLSRDAVSSLPRGLSSLMQGSTSAGK